MQVNNALEAGAVINTYTLKALAPSKNGHSRWIVDCVCGRQQEVRASRLRDGTAVCRCQPKAPASAPAPQAGHAGIGVTVEALEQRLAIVESTIVEQAKQLAEILQRLAPPAPPARTPITKQSIMAGTTTSEERMQRLADNMDTAEALLKAGDKAHRDEVRERLMIELDSADVDIELERKDARQIRWVQANRDLKNWY